VGVEAMDIRQKNGAWGGREGELDVPYYLLGPAMLLIKNNCEISYINWLFYFLDIIILYKFPQTLYKF
jgi:hypothetical protein